LEPRDPSEKATSIPGSLSSTTRLAKEREPGIEIEEKVVHLRYVTEMK